MGKNQSKVAVSLATPGSLYPGVNGSLISTYLGCFQTGSNTFAHTAPNGNQYSAKKCEKYALYDGTSTTFGMSNQNQFNQAVCNYGASTNDPTTMPISTGCTGFDVSGNIVGAGNSVALYQIPQSLPTLATSVFRNTGGYRY